MRFSAYFNIGLSQPELDFVDVELDEDMRLFIDPYVVATRADALSVSCSRDITIFFQEFIDRICAADHEGARTLLGNLHEPNETRLGLSAGFPRGSGISGQLADKIFSALVQSRAIETGFIKDISDTELFVPGIGPDKISDLATNLIRHRLIEYTQEQCRLHGIALRGTVASGPLWDSEQLAWTSDHVPLPVSDGKKVLLVPKYLVRWNPQISPQEYYQHYVLNFLQAQEMANPASALVQLVRGVRKPPTKKELQQRFPGNKAFLLEFSKNNPAVLDEYKKDKSYAQTLSNADLLEDFDSVAFANVLSRHLQRIPLGSDGATEYHKFMVGTLSFIFYPNLVYPKVEAEIHDGRKRIDIVYTNGVRSGIFQRFTQQTRRIAAAIMVECKNYTREVENPEIDQLSGRFGDNRGWLGFLVCRHVDDKLRLLARCRDTARDGRGFMIPLDDSDVQAMLRHVMNRTPSAIDGHLDTLFSELLR